MRENRVVTVFLMHKGMILILKRSGNVGSFRGLWGGVSGYIEGDERPEERARAEIREETGISEKDIELVRAGIPFSVKEKDIVWVVHPFLFESRTVGVRLDMEHSELRWIRPEDLGKFKTVKDLDKSLKAVINVIS